MFALDTHPNNTFQHTRSTVLSLATLLLHSDRESKGVADTSKTEENVMLQVGVSDLLRELWELKHSCYGYLSSVSEKAILCVLIPWLVNQVGLNCKVRHKSDKNSAAYLQDIPRKPHTVVSIPSGPEIVTWSEVTVISFGTEIKYFNTVLTSRTIPSESWILMWW